MLKMMPASDFSMDVNNIPFNPISKIASMPIYNKNDKEVREAFNFSFPVDKED